MDPTSSRKDLFEYQQGKMRNSLIKPLHNYLFWNLAQLEAEIEDLSYKIERAETTDRSVIENQMDICEKRRITLLKDFFPSGSESNCYSVS